eukprot:2181727-Rhodomonas_salina.1
MSSIVHLECPSTPSFSPTTDHTAALPSGSLLAVSTRLYLDMCTIRVTAASCAFHRMTSTQSSRWKCKSWSKTWETSHICSHPELSPANKKLSVWSTSND